MTPIVLAHTVFCVIALFAGGYIFATTKGTVGHVRIGKVYAASMLLLLATSFFIFDLFGTFGAYHALALVSLVTLGLGMYAAIWGRPSRYWLLSHYMWMSYSYVGLVMAGGSHLINAFPEWPTWLSLGLFWGVPLVGGGALINLNRKRILAETSQRKGLDVVVR